MTDLLAVGCYTPESGGRGRGITIVGRDAATGRLGEISAVLPAPSPSHLAPAGHPGLVHAAHELADGAVSTWRLHPGGGGEQLAQVPSGGGFPCHVAVHPSGRLLVVSDYGGSVGVISTRDGVVDELVQVVTPRGSGPRAERQEGPHPHSAAFLDDRHVVVADLGTDELRVHAVDVETGAVPRLDPEPLQVLRTAPGAGPRTLLLRGRYLHVTGELDATLVTAEVHGGRLGPPHAVRALVAEPAGAAEWPSEVTGLGEHLLLATRGVDVLSVHEVTAGPEPTGGRTRPVIDLPLAGEHLPHPAAAHPRHVVAVGRHVYVSAQDADLLLHLELAGTGADVRVVGHSAVRTGSPTVVLPL